MRRLSIDADGAKWAYSIGFWHKEAGCPFDAHTPHAEYWWMGAIRKRFEFKGADGE